MSKSNDYLDAVMARHRIHSDYGLAKILGTQPNRISGIRHRQRRLTEEMALRVAELLELHPGQVMAEIRAERAKRTPVKRVWERVARALSSLIIAGILGAYAALSAPDARAGAAPAALNTVTLMRILSAIAWAAWAAARMADLVP